MSAIEGGHITDIGSANREIRDIVEARNATRAQVLAAAAAAHSGSPCCTDIGTCILSPEDIEELEEEIEDAVSIDEGGPIVNPKDAVGSTKVPLHLWPVTATALGSIALLNGMLKYGRGNWREIGVRASTYIDACQRHLTAWFEGEANDEEGVPHLASALACLAILVDAEAAGKLKDDRNYPGGYRETIEKLTPLVSEIRQRHADKSPKHYTIDDSLP